MSRGAQPGRLAVQPLAQTHTVGTSTAPLLLLKLWQLPRGLVYVWLSLCALQSEGHGSHTRICQCVQPKRASGPAKEPECDLPVSGSLNSDLSQRIGTLASEDDLSGTHLQCAPFVRHGTGSRALDPLAVR